MMASLAAEESLLLVDNSQMPYHGNQRNQPQCNRSQMPQVHCDRYDDVVDLITQVELVEKIKFSHWGRCGWLLGNGVLKPDVLQKPWKKRCFLSGGCRAENAGRGLCVLFGQGC